MPDCQDSFGKRILGLEHQSGSDARTAGARNWKHKIDHNSKDHSPFKKRSIVVPGRGTLGRTK
jgi:hypothetical protein